MAWSSESSDTLDTVDALDMLELLDTGRVVVFRPGFDFSSSLSFAAGTEPNVVLGASDGGLNLSSTCRGLGLPVQLVRECKIPPGGLSTAAASAPLPVGAFVCAETLLDVKAAVAAAVALGDKDLLFICCEAGLVELSGTLGEGGIFRLPEISCSDGLFVVSGNEDRLLRVTRGLTCSCDDHLLAGSDLRARVAVSACRRASPARRLL
jgi:hypothetical protein